MLNYKVEIIPKGKGKEWILNKHYAKRMPPITFFRTTKKDAVVQAINQFLIWYSNEKV